LPTTDDFLSSKYSIGRIVEPPKSQRLSGEEPSTKRALVIGLNYPWLPENSLETPEREASGCKKVGKKGYKVIVLRGKNATPKNVKKELCEEVSVFHFSGHENS
jgi:hypothetical protein